MFDWGTWEVMQEGNDAAVLAVGTMVDQSMKAANLLANKGIHVTVVNCRFVKPFDMKMLQEIAAKHTRLITVEEGTLVGGFGSGVNDWLTDTGHDQITLQRLGIPDQFIEHGSRNEQLKLIGLHPEGIAGAIEGFLGKEGKHSLKLKQETTPTVNRIDSIKIAAKGKT